MNNINTILNNELESAQLVFNQSNLYKHILIPEFDCSGLPPTQTDGKALPEKLISEFFWYLHRFDNTDKINDYPCIYTFELAHENDRNRVIHSFQKQQKIKIERTLPALKNKIPDSNYLYVGKVQKEVGGRLVTHLGYYQSKGNHGLQLAYWAREMSPPLIINVHIFRFSKEFEPYISAFEVIMAKKLEPIIGKH